MTKTRRWSLLVTVGLGLLLITLDNSILYTALPTLTDELDASASEGLWIINAYPLVMAGLLLGAGTLGDRIGHRRMFLVGLCIFGLSSLAAAFAWNPEILIAARASLAVGAAAMMPATLALIRIAFVDDKERNLAIAVWGSISLIGSAVGPIVGGAMLAHFWWGSVFLLNVPVVLVAIVATVVVAPPNVIDPSRTWDLLSSIQITVALATLVFAIKEVVSIDRSWSVVVVCAAVFIFAATVFARRQQRLTYPLLDFSIFKNAAVLSGVLAAGLTMFSVAGIQLVTTQRFQLVEQFTPLEAGLLVSALAVGSLSTALLGGALLHVIGLRFLISGGLALAAVGVATTVIGLQINLVALVFGLILTGAGLGAAAAVASTAIIGNVPVGRAGMASSVEEVSYEFGSLAAVALLGSLISALYSAAVVLPPSVPADARASLGNTLQAVGDSAELRQAAFDAFDSGYITVLVIIAVVSAAGAMVTWRLLRSYGPGSPASSHPTVESVH